ncbi:DUF1993 domain-containing protein [Sphingomonas sp. BN140010]|uniref:DUF1993 domain-containing protein n=1 Tax=Sphingomonas arvum TaxID=2992113 RepID=A0ABT3JB61_9SPHN|nr:DUF1993 domain-containing protein [Sphingomonas sp. BN140010]MCW3796290.1 DUF1993 domain-containing protein [Sphingomonas sp. BN140010]
MQLTQFLIPTLNHQLAALGQWLDKAEAFAETRAEAPDRLLNLRLAPDMWPLASQIRITAFQAQEALFRLRGRAVPDAVVAVRTEASNAGEQPGSWADARARLNEAAALVGTVRVDEFDADPQAPLAHALPMGMTFDMTRESYVRDWALPQVAFHQCMTYAILRQAGVPLGKVDFVPHMFGYLRPGTMPQA